MDEEIFENKLVKADNLVKNEKYEEAMELLNDLKKIEDEEDFNYNLTHKLYQLISNTESLHNQQIIIDIIRKNIDDNQMIELTTLYELLKADNSIQIERSILKREIELLILRGVLKGNLKEDKIILDE
ncbi:MAG: hypothetical protein BAJALOKI2v1_470012 [Promethearchaeota archaeon]|nr:MAG: hypothetical protein BAJALOKI2v1_470012 [Candidatus Lokiarchaeota archaeon]